MTHTDDHSEQDLYDTNDNDYDDDETCVQSKPGWKSKSSGRCRQCTALLSFSVFMAKSNRSAGVAYSQVDENAGLPL